MGSTRYYIPVKREYLEAQLQVALPLAIQFVEEHGNPHKIELTEVREGVKYVGCPRTKQKTNSKKR